jgi:hypothetical protein
MLKFALGMGSIVMMFMTLIVSYVAMSIWVSAAKYFLLK